LPKVPGFSLDLDQAEAFVFATGVIAPAQVIEQTETTGWVALYALGGLPIANGFTSPEQAADTIITCMTQSTFYENFTTRTDLDSSATTVDGADAWVITSEIRIDNPELQVTGDVAKVIVVDTGDPTSYGLFISVVPIGDQDLIDQQRSQEALLSLR